MNYTELVAELESFSENTFETADIDTCIKLAEQRIYNSVQPPVLRKTATVSLVSGTATAAVPADFLYPFSLAVIVSGDYGYLLNKDVNFIRECYPDPTDTGVPACYALQDAETLLFGPTPNSNYSCSLNYGAYPESIVTASTTWLGDNFDSVLFNAALYEAALFMKQDVETLKMYEDRYVKSLALFKNLGDGKLRQDAYRSGQVRTEVA